MTEQLGLKDQIEQLINETRVVLPGVQALLGFQLAAVFTNGFKDLAEWLQLVHLASLGAICLATILLMAPTMRHRLVEQGRVSEELYHYGSRMVVAAMMIISLGLSGDLLVVTATITQNLYVAIGALACSLAVSWLVWFGYPVAKRSGQRAQQ